MFVFKINSKCTEYLNRIDYKVKLKDTQLLVLWNILDVLEIILFYKNIH